MPIRFKCPHCKKSLVVKEQMAGKKAACPACKKPLIVPAPTSQALDVEALAAAALSDKPAAEEKKDAAAPAPPIVLPCPWCGEEAKFDADMGGKQAPCPNPECRRIIKVPLPLGNKQKDWREVHRGPSAALANQPEQLDGAWGTATNRGMVSGQSLVEAGAVEEDTEPIGVGGWIKRGLLVMVIGAVVFLGVSGLKRQREKKADKDAIEQALEGLKDPKLPPAWTVVILRGAGEHLTSKRIANKAHEYFRTAQARLARLPSSPDRDLLALSVALPQIELGGSDEEARDNERISWNKLVDALGRTLDDISDAEPRARAVREVGTRLIKRKQSNVALSLPGRLGATATKGLHGELLKAQAAALMGKRAAEVVPPPNFKLKLDDRTTRLGHAEANARQGDLDAAKQCVTAPGNLGHSFEAAIGVAAVLHSEGKEFGQFLELAGDYAKGVKKITSWQMLELVRLHARAGAADQAHVWLKQLPDKQMKNWGELEIFLAELARSDKKVEATRVEQVGDKDSLPRALAWEAFARHNTRHDFRGEVSALVDNAGDDPERKRIAPLLHLGMALGAQDR